MIGLGHSERGLLLTMTKKICLIIIGCLLVSVGVTVYQNDKGIDYAPKIYSVRNFICSDCIVEKDGKTVVTTGDDPQFIIELDGQYVNNIMIYCDAQPEDWQLAVFYGTEDEEFNAENSIIRKISESPSKINVDLKKKVKRLRIDLGDSQGLTFAINKIVICNVIQNPDRTKLIEYWLVRPLRVASQDTWRKALVLFCVMSGLALSMRRYYKKALCTIFFCGVILLVIFNNSRLTSPPSIYDNEGILDFTLYAKEYENWLDDNIGYKKNFIDLNAIVLYKLLGISTNDDIAAGKSGWLFYKGDNNLEIAQESYPMESVDYVEIAQLLNKARVYLKNRGIDFFFVSPAAKPSIYPEYLRGNYTVVETPSTKLYSAVKKYMDAEFIYLKETMLMEKNNSLLYYKTDSHWNEYGSFMGYKAIYKTMTDLGILEGKLPEVEWGEGLRDGDLGNMIASEAVIPDEPCIQIMLTHRYAYLIKDGKEYEELDALKEKMGIQQFSIYKNDICEKGKKILVFGDSYFADSGKTNLTDLMAENCSELVYVWGWPSKSVVDAIQPDVVVFERGERELQYIKSILEQFTAR